VRIWPDERAETHCEGSVVKISAKIGIFRLYELFIGALRQHFGLSVSSRKKGDWSKATREYIRRTT
jgi:hypothetical protein